MLDLSGSIPWKKGVLMDRSISVYHTFLPEKGQIVNFVCENRPISGGVLWEFRRRCINVRQWLTFDRGCVKVLLENK